LPRGVKIEEREEVPMWNPIIGENAGKVWQTLRTKGPQSPTAVKKAAALDDKNLYMALGWLAREGKLKFEMKQLQLLVSLK
jgi:hypothetical protein